MQAAARRPQAVSGQRRSDKLIATPHLVAADDTGLLDALPIAAAIVERDAAGLLHVASFNSRFCDMISRANGTALDWSDADCLRSGEIADLLHGFFDGKNLSSDLDFRDGEGVSSRFLRMKLAPLARRDGCHARCLLSVVDRTVEVQAER